MEIVAVKNMTILEELLEQHFFKETLTNNYILAKEYEDHITNNRLWYWTSDSNLFLFLEKEGFFRLYYLVNNTSIQHDFGTLKLVLEIIYRGEKHLPLSHIDYWTKNGFQKHLSRDCYFLKASKLSLEDNIGEGFNILPVKDIPDIKFAKNLIDQYLDIYTGDRLTLQQLQKFSNQEFLYVAFKNDIPCGMLQAELKNNVFWLGHLVVHEDFRGLGLAHNLVNYYLEQGLKYEVNQFQLWVINDNLPAVKLYKNKGFNYLNKSTYSMLKIN